MTIITEVLQLSIDNEAFDKQPELFTRLREGARKAGIVNQAYGREIEDPTVIYWLIRTFA